MPGIDLSDDDYRQERCVPLLGTVWRHENSIGASREGFEDPLAPNVPESPDAPDTSRKVTISSDTQYEIQLVRRFGIDPVSVGGA